MSKNLKTTESSNDSIERFLAEDSLGLENFMPVFPRSDYLEILKKELLPDGPESKHNNMRYLMLSGRARNAVQPVGVGSKDQEISPAKSKLLSFLFYLIYRNLSKELSPNSNYYCEVSHELNPELDYGEREAYEVVKNIERQERHLPELKRKVDLMYVQIANYAPSKKTLTQQVAEMAKIKMGLRGSVSFEAARTLLDLYAERLDLDKLAVCKELKVFVEAEGAWLLLCNTASQFKDDNDPKFVELLAFLKKESLSDYPAFNNYNVPDSELQPVTPEVKEAIWSLMCRARRSRERLDCAVNDGKFALGWSADSISTSKIDAASFIWHNEKIGAEGNLQVSQHYLDRAIKEKSPDILYGVSQGHKKYYDCLVDGSELKRLQEYLIADDAKYDENLRDVQVYFLDLAASAGSVEAKYELSEHYMEKIALYPQEGYESEIPALSKEDTLAKHQYFLSLAASHGHAKAQYQYAVELEASYAAPEAYYSYYVKAMQQGLEEAAEKFEEAKQYAYSIDPVTISAEEFEFLEAMSKIDDYSTLCLAKCYHIDSKFMVKKFESGGRDERPQKVLMIYAELLYSNPDPQIKLRINQSIGGVDILKQMLLEPLPQDLIGVLDALNDEKDKRPSHEKYSLSCSIIDLLSQVEKKKRAPLKEVIILAKKVIEQAANAGSNDARIRHGISLQESGESQQALMLFSDALASAKVNENIAKSKVDTLMRIGRLLEKPKILLNIPFNYNLILNLSYLELDNKSKCNLTKRISEVLAENPQYQGQEISHLRSVETKILLSGANDKGGAYKPAQDLLILGFCDGKYGPPTTVITEFRKWATPAMKVQIADRLCNPMWPLSEDREFCDSELLEYCKIPKVKEEVRNLRPDLILPDDVREKKVQNPIEASDISSPPESPFLALRTPLKSPKSPQTNEPSKQQKKRLKAAEKALQIKEARSLIAELQAEDLSETPPNSPSTAVVAEVIQLPEETLIEDRGAEMDVFLQNKKKLKFFVNLPGFLQEQFKKLFEENKGCEIILKGSKFYRSAETSRVPSDLDIEILIPKMSSWPRRKIEEFIADNCGSNDGVTIYNQPPNFTVNFKDEQRDYVFYDSAKEPDINFSWTSNREERVLCDSASLSLEYLPPRGFGEHLTKLKAENPAFKYDSKNDFIINPQARGLLLRLSFLQAIGVATGKEIEAAICKDLKVGNHHIDPIDLLVREFKLNHASNQQVEGKVRAKIEAVIKSHFADNDKGGEFKTSFIESLNRIANLKNPNADKSNITDCIRGKIRKTISSLREEITSAHQIPDSVTASITFSVLKKRSSVLSQ
jgi:hypothetical protein